MVNMRSYALDRPVGRPRRFESLEALQAAVATYFNNCAGAPVPMKDANGQVMVDDNGETQYRTTRPVRPPTVTGLARALGTNRQTLCNIQQLGHYPDEFIDTIKDAKLQVEIWLEESMLLGHVKPAAGIFVLKNNHGWIDESTRKVQDVERPGSLMEKRRQKVSEGKRKLIGSGRTDSDGEIIEDDDNVIEVPHG